MHDLDINTTSDWMRALALALDNNDTSLLDELTNISNDWLQSEDEKDAQLSLIYAAEAAIDEIKSFDY